jgi:hypothetical protein
MRPLNFTVRGVVAPTRMLRFILITLALSPGAHAAGLAPWEFAMSREQVSGFKEFGPYNAFSNGDLETFNGIFDGHKENIQFFFNESGLTRIGVYVYEGTDVSAATSAWRHCYGTLTRLYGKLETPGLATTSGKAPDLDKMAMEVRSKVVSGVKVQMAPFEQPEKLFVYSSIWRSENQGSQHFYVVIYIDPPHP